MLIDLVAVDVVMIASCALHVMLRASRHILRLQRSQQHQQSHNVTSHQATAATSNSSSTTDAQSWERLHGVSHLQDVGLLPPSPSHTPLEQPPSSGRPSSSMELLSSCHVVADVLALISNSLTHLLRPSQVIYALFLCTCDALILGRDRPGNRFRYLLVLFGLVVLLSIFHTGTIGFGAGDWSGYFGGVLQLFLLGATVGSATGPTLSANAASSANHPTNRAVLSEYMLERSAGCISSFCYLVMLLDEGEAVYSSHMELIRWYGSTVAALLIDAVQCYQVARGKFRLEVD